MKQDRDRGISGNRTSGSPQPGEPVYISIGMINRPHGVHGEMLMSVDTEFPERIVPGLNVFVGNKKRSFEISSVRPSSKQLLISFPQVTDPESAGMLRNQVVYIEASNKMKLPPGRYYMHDVLGMTVIDESGETLGIITEILITGANDVYVVKADSGSEILIPAIKSTVKKIDPETRQVTVKLQEWL